MSLNGAMLRLGTGAAAAARGALAKPSYGAALAVTARRNMTTFEERERGEEAVFMRQEDRKLLQKILKKEKAAKEEATDKKAELMAILGDNKLPSDVIGSLLAWKSSE